MGVGYYGVDEDRANALGNYLMHYGRKGMKWGENKFGDYEEKNITINSNNLFDRKRTVTTSVSGMGKGSTTKTNYYERGKITQAYDNGKKAAKEVLESIKGDKAKQRYIDAQINAIKTGSGGESKEAREIKDRMDIIDNANALLDKSEQLYKETVSDKRKLLDFKGKKEDKEFYDDLNKQRNELKIDKQREINKYMQQRKSDYEKWEKAEAMKRLSKKLNDNTIASKLQNLKSEVANTADEAGDAVASAVKDAGKWVGDKVDKAGNAVGKAAKDTGNWIGDKAGKAGKAVSGAAKDVGNWGSKQVDKGKKLLKSIFG